jgi:transposase
VAKKPRRRRYSAEFIEQAIRLVEKGPDGLNAVAAKLGVSQGTLSRWMSRAGKSSVEVVDVELTPEQELKELRKRVKELELEREILKKATAFFAKENT